MGIIRAEAESIFNELLAGKDPREIKGDNRATKAKVYKRYLYIKAINRMTIDMVRNKYPIHSKTLLKIIGDSK